MHRTSVEHLVRRPVDACFAHGESDRVAYRSADACCSGAQARPRDWWGVRDKPAWIEAPARRKHGPPEEQRPAGPQPYVAAMMTWSAPGQPLGHPSRLAHSVAFLLEVVDREGLWLPRGGKGSVAELLDDWHELGLGEAVECISGLPEVDHAPAPVDRAG